MVEHFVTVSLIIRDEDSLDEELLEAFFERVFDDYKYVSILRTSVKFSVV